jgi:transcriptional regulator with XRE-family HTH domain
MKQLRLARERHGLTQSQLADGLGTTQQTIARWEAGKAEPNLAALRDLAICLDTTVDVLLGRPSLLEHQTTNPVAWLSGDKSGYWGNIGVRLPHNKFSTWYPITTSVMERVFRELQNVEMNTWISFQTLNNKMVICRPSRLPALTFLDEAEDQIEDDWKVGPDDVEGWPQEIYECLEYLMWEDLGDPSNGNEFSDKLISTTEDLIREYGFDHQKLMERCVKTQITHTDGTTRWLHVSSERLAHAMFFFDIGIEDSGSMMLHLDDEDGDHSVFLSLDLISRLEFPLLALKKGMQDQQGDNANNDASGITREAKDTRSSDGHEHNA